MRRPSVRPTTIWREEDPADVVVIGGGSGVSRVLRSLSGTGLTTTAVVTAADDGGSSGLIREEADYAPGLGDLRQAILAMAPELEDTKLLRGLLAHRFPDCVNEHALGNLILLALIQWQRNRSAPLAIETLRQELRMKGRVILAAETPVRLCLRFSKSGTENGVVVCGEHVLDTAAHEGELPILDAWLAPSEPGNPIRASSDAWAAILRAKLVVIGPGSLYGSLVASLLPEGIADALRSTLAKVVAVVNLTDHRTDSAGMAASDFLRVLERYAGPGAIDVAVTNTKRPSSATLDAYRDEGQELMRVDPGNFPSGIKVLRKHLLHEEEGHLRHDTEALRKVLLSLLPANLRRRALESALALP